MKDKYTIALVGVCCITAITVACIVTGIDGAIVGSALATIGTIIGGIFGYLKGKGE